MLSLRSKGHGFDFNMKLITANDISRCFARKAGPSLISVVPHPKVFWGFYEQMEVWEEWAL